VVQGRYSQSRADGCIRALVNNAKTRCGCVTNWISALSGLRSRWWQRRPIAYNKREFAEAIAHAGHEPGPRSPVEESVLGCGMNSKSCATIATTLWCLHD
jgi:hypothetical protein